MFKQIRIGMLVSSLALIGCTKMTPSQVAFDQVSLGKIYKSSNRPACEIQPAEYTIDTRMVAFDITTSGGVHAGFNLLTGFLKLLSVDMKASSGRMVTGMSLYDAVSPKYELVNVMGSGRSVNFGAEVSLGIQNIGAGFNFEHKTPLTSLIESSLSETFGLLYGEMSRLQEPWHTQVAAVPSANEVVIPVGAYAGLKVGDQFAVYNVQHVWGGTPCQSEHLMARKTSSSPLAVGTVVQIANNAALLLLQKRDDVSSMDPTPIEQGARVEIFKLVEPNRQLARVVTLRSVGGAQIAYENAFKVDVSAPLREHVRAMARNYGFLVYAP